MQDFLGEWTTIVSILSLFGVSFAVEKSPIKINPISMIKKFFTNEIEEDLKKVHASIENNHEKSEANHRETLSLIKALENKMKETEEIIDKRIEEKENEIKVILDSNEKDRIRSIFLEHQELVNNGIKIGDTMYMHLLDIYDKYTNVLGGNSFVCDIMNKIKESRE